MDHYFKEFPKSLNIINASSFWIKTFISEYTNWKLCMLVYSSSNLMPISIPILHLSLISFTGFLAHSISISVSDGNLYSFTQFLYSSSYSSLPFSFHLPLSFHSSPVHAFSYPSICSEYDWGSGNGSDTDWLCISCIILFHFASAQVLFFFVFPHGLLHLNVWSICNFLSCGCVLPVVWCVLKESCHGQHAMCNFNMNRLFSGFPGAMDSANSLNQAQWVSDFFPSRHIKKSSQRRSRLSSWLIGPWIKWLQLGKKTDIELFRFSVIYIAVLWI